MHRARDSSASVRDTESHDEMLEFDDLVGEKNYLMI